MQLFLQKVIFVNIPWCTQITDLSSVLCARRPLNHRVTYDYTAEFTLASGLSNVLIVIRRSRLKTIWQDTIQKRTAVKDPLSAATVKWLLLGQYILKITRGHIKIYGTNVPSASNHSAIAQTWKDTAESMRGRNHLSVGFVGKSSSHTLYCDTIPKLVSISFWIETQTVK